MGNSLPAFIMGGCLLAFSIGLAWRQWKAGQETAGDDDLTRRHLRRRHFRRWQIIVLLMGVGIAIPLGDALPALRQKPALFAFYWMGVLAVTGWIIMLALGDLAATTVYGKAAGHRLERQRRALEEEVARHRKDQSQTRRPMPPPSLN